jgi:hypothetical protein
MTKKLVVSLQVYEKLKQIFGDDTKTCVEPVLTRSQKEEILTAHHIHCGKVSRCSVCGHPLPKVSGCHACQNCRSNIGDCG